MGKCHTLADCAAASPVAKAGACLPLRGFGTDGGDVLGSGLDRVPAFVRAGTAILCCAGIGFLDERLKIFVPGRHYDVTEFYLNAAAAAVIIVLYFILVWLLWRRRRRKRE